MGMGTRDEGEKKEGKENMLRRTKWKQKFCKGLKGREENGRKKKTQLYYVHGQVCMMNLIIVYL